jgi:hypothetical protein
VLPTVAERALAPISSSSYGIGSIANPYLNNDLGTIIAFPGETFGLMREVFGLTFQEYSIDILIVNSDFVRPGEISGHPLDSVVEFGG